MAATTAGARTLYLPQLERDACGVGFVASVRAESSAKLVREAQTMLERMEHRGACGCDDSSGDGAGVMTALPDKLYRRELRLEGIELPPLGKYATGLLFFDADSYKQGKFKSVNVNDAAAWSIGSDEPLPSTLAVRVWPNLSDQSMRRKYVQEGESDQSTVSLAGARREIRGQVDWQSDGGDSTADAPAATEQQAAAASAASARVLPDVKKVPPPPLNHKPFPLLVKKEELGDG